MTKAQEARLRSSIPSGEDAIVKCLIHHVWQVSEDEEADNQHNAEMWKDISKEADIIAGVFPPPAIVGLIMARGEADDGNEEFSDVRRIEVLTPVSRVSQTMENGRRENRFTFLRWQRI